MCLNNDVDQVSWSGCMNGIVVDVADLYNTNISSSLGVLDQRFLLALWKHKIPIKILLFVWLLWRNRILTSDNLIKRGFQGPGLCSFYKQEAETICHIFFQCTLVQGIWIWFLDLLRDHSWCPLDLLHSILSQTPSDQRFISLPFFLLWEVWLARNIIIFEDGYLVPHKIFGAIMGWMELQDAPAPSITDFSHRLQPHLVSLQVFLTMLSNRVL